MQGSGPIGSERRLPTYVFLLMILFSSWPTACTPSGGQTMDTLQDQGDDPEPARPALFQDRLPPSGEAWVIFSPDTVRAEVARSPAEREEGLMNRETLPAGRGMLFVFPDLQIRSFWMKNTFLPLDIAYLDDELRIVDLQTMEPQSEDLHSSAMPAMFALEVPAGWFAEREIEIGDQAQVVFGPGRG